jgi:D-sedoheptulose 7-phosphate isomerase
VENEIKLIEIEIEESIKVKNELLNNKRTIAEIDKIAKKSIMQLKKGNKILLAGNGGSAADAQHIAGELVSRFYFDRPALPAMALTTDTSILTAIGNDYGYEQLFSRQIEGNGAEGDIFIAISTSGNSKNIIEALKIAKSKKLITIGFSGSQIGLMDELCDFNLKAPSTSTPRIQEAHILIGHTICMLIEKTIFGN